MRRRSTARVGRALGRVRERRRAGVRPPRRRPLWRPEGATGRGCHLREARRVAGRRAGRVDARARGSPFRAPRRGAGSSGRPGCGSRLNSRGATSFGVAGWKSDARSWIVPATRPELPLPAAVGADAVVLAVVVRREEPLDRAEPRRLHVHRARGPAERLDVLDGVDGGIPGHAVAVRLEHGHRLVGERGVLEPRFWQTLGDAPVERGVRRRVHRRPLVVALEVDRVDRTGGGELGDELVGPLRVRVELEAEARVEARATLGSAPSRAARRGSSRRRT